MKRYLLDTDICIYVIKKRPRRVFDKFDRLKVGQVAISAITYSELQYGIENSRSKDSNREALKKFMGPLDVLDYPVAAGPCYGEIRYRLKKAGRLIGSNDLLIAAHALALDCILVTNNTKEFSRIEELELENWANP